MTDGVKKLTYIAFKRITRACVVSGNLAEHVFNSQHSVVRSFANATGERSWYKSRLKNGTKNLKDGMMENAITNNGLVDMTKFWIINVKIGIWSMSVSFIQQTSVQGKNMLFQIFLKIYNITLMPFATLKLIPSQKEIFWVDYFCK